MRVLVSGASIAGPSLAYWLVRNGHEVTIVERAAHPRTSGSPIDVRGPALATAERMGMLAGIRAARVDTEGIEFVDAAGRRRATLRPPVYVDGSPDIEVERADLVRLLYDATKDGAEYVFEDSIDTLTQDADGVDVTFVHGAARRFDHVVGADGLHSIVRRLTFGEESRFVHHLGYYIALVSVDPALGRENWGLMHNSPGRLAGVYGYHGKADAVFLFRSPQLSYDYHDLDQQKKLLTDAFAGAGWRVPALLAEARAAEDVYFDSVSQVRMPSWTLGRVALLGDSGYGPSGLSGMGATVAMVGAEWLAGALESGDLAGYERAHRPLVAEAHAMAARGGGMLVPATRFAIWRRDQLARLAPLLAKPMELLKR